jgi:hypothetical protein
MSAAIIDIADPTVRLYRRWLVLWEAGEEAEDDDELNALGDQWRAIEDELRATPARSVMGALSKLKCAIDQNDGDMSFGNLAELLASAMMDLERLARREGGTS